MSDATRIAAEAARAAASPQSRFTPYVMGREFDLFLGNDTQYQIALQTWSLCAASDAVMPGTSTSRS
jgi:hypothetical protein